MQIARHHHLTFGLNVLSDSYIVCSHRHTRMGMGQNRRLNHALDHRFATQILQGLAGKSRTRIPRRNDDAESRAAHGRKLFLFDGLCKQILNFCKNCGVLVGPRKQFRARTVSKYRHRNARVMSGRKVHRRLTPCLVPIR